MNTKTYTVATTIALLGLGVTSLATASAAPLADGTPAASASPIAAVSVQAAAPAPNASPVSAAPAPTAPAAAEQTPTPTADATASPDAAAWAASPQAMAVKNCESTNNPTTNTGNGYYGAWQFDIPSWLAYGGGAYAERPDLAPAWAQDQVAFNYYQAAGWTPWECASLV